MAFRALGVNDVPVASKRPDQRRRWQDPYVYAGVISGSALLRTLGPGFSGRLLGEIGDLFGRAPFNRPRIERSIANIRWCFPEMGEHRAAAIAHASYRHLFMLAGEQSMSAHEYNFARWPHWIELGDVQEAVQLMLSGPSILITGHCGNWELLGAWLGALGLPLHAVYRPFDNLALDAWVRRTRSRLGIELVDKFGAADALPIALERNELVAFIADQNAGDRGIYVPFFDRLASTYKSIGLLAMRHNAPIICGVANRSSATSDAAAPQRFQYTINVVDIIKPDDWADQADPLFYVTARYRRAMELMIRRAPEQYLWMQKAWRSRPRFEREEKPFPNQLRAKLESLPWMTTTSLARIVESSGVMSTTANHAVASPV